MKHRLLTINKVASCQTLTSIESLTIKISCFFDRKDALRRDKKSDLTMNMEMNADQSSGVQDNVELIAPQPRQKKQKEPSLSLVKVIAKHYGITVLVVSIHSAGSKYT